MKKIKKTLLGFIAIMGGVAPIYAGKTELSEISPGKSRSKAACGLKTNLDFIDNQRYQGEHAKKNDYQTIGGDGLVMNPLSGQATLEKVVAAGGNGNKGGHGVAAYGGPASLIIDESIITGGAVSYDHNSLQQASSKASRFAGGAGVFCRTATDQPMDISINKSTITGGAMSSRTGSSDKTSRAGNGINVIGAANITLNNSAVASGNNGRAADGISTGGGTITLVKSSVKSTGAAGIAIMAPAVISVDNNSKINGGKKGGIGINAHSGAEIILSGTVKGNYYAVFFNGHDNALTLQNGFNLKGKLAAAGKNNCLNLKSANKDDNSLNLDIFALVDNQQGFTDLHKMAEGNWTLNNSNVAIGGLKRVVVEQGSMTLAKTAVLSAGEIYNAPGAFLGGSGIIKGRVKNAGTLYMGRMQNNIAPFQALTLDGDYHGEQGSRLVFNTRLGGDNSLTDKLIIRGNISGNSLVQINNLAGAGARTDKGILIIEAQNGDERPSAGTFSLSQRVVAGAFDYFLKREGNHWLLSTDLPGQSVPLDSVRPPRGSETADSAMPPAKPPRTFANKEAPADSRLNAGCHRGGSPGLSVIAGEPAETLPQTPAEIPAETNQLLVTKITGNGESAAASDDSAETNRRGVSAPSARAAAAIYPVGEDVSAVLEVMAAAPAALPGSALSDAALPDEAGEDPAPLFSDGTAKSAAGVIQPQDPAGAASAVKRMPLRPEPGIYAANLAAANTLFVTRMHDRTGEPAYPGAMEYDESASALWLRVVGGRNNASVAQGQIATQTYSHLVQLGGEILHIGSEGADGIHIGLMAGRGQSRSRSRAALTGYEAKGGIEGYALGFYGTWHQYADRLKGPYLDVSLNYSWFDNRVNGEALPAENYRSQGWTGGLEAGYHRQLYSGAEMDAYLQPQLHITWMGVRAAHVETNGDKFTLLGSGNIQSRLGSRFYLEKRFQGPDGRRQLFKPYVETNWIHHSRAFGVAINGRRLLQEGGRHLAEIKIGHEGQVNRQVAVWGSLGHQAGGGGFSNTVGTLGIKARF